MPKVPLDQWDLNCSFFSEIPEETGWILRSKVHAENQWLLPL